MCIEKIPFSKRNLMKKHILTVICIICILNGILDAGMTPICERSIFPASGIFPPKKSFEKMWAKPRPQTIASTLQGTNISHQKSLLKMIFLFPRWVFVSSLGGITPKPVFCPRFLHKKKTGGLYHTLWRSLDQRLGENREGLELVGV